LPGQVLPDGTFLPLSAFSQGLVYLRNPDGSMDLERDGRDEAQRLLEQAEREIESIKAVIGAGDASAGGPLRPEPPARIGQSAAAVGESRPLGGVPARPSLQRRLASLADLPD
jgi:hypothetical protein